MARSVAAPEALGLDEARARVLAAVGPGPEETIPIERALGRAARSPLVSTIDLPPFRNASMDGAAVRTADLAGGTPGRQIELPVSAVFPAGAAPGRIAPGTCAWIMTGAPLPLGADAVVPIEELAPVSGASPERAGGAVRFPTGVGPGANVREAGADTRTGQILWEAGRELSAHDLGLLAAMGRADVVVGARPRVAVISTGDELLDPGTPLRAGAIYDSNRPMLGALIEESGCRLVSSERVGDEPAPLEAVIDRALAAADVTITIGGVSAGAFDPVKLGIAGRLGLASWRVAMKPGRPQAFGVTQGRLFFGLPGNPASVACVFEALVRPALRKLQGFAALDRPTITVRATRSIESRAGRTDLVRVTLEERDGAWWAAEAGAQVSGHVSPQSRAHALLVIPESTARLDEGVPAKAWVLRWPQEG